MIFPGHLELADINAYRDKGMKRQWDILGDDFKGVGTLEFEIIECLERLYDKEPALPQVIVKEYGDPRNTDFSGARMYSKIDNDGRYYIYLDWKEVIRLYSYTELMFGKTWLEYMIEREKKRGIVYKPYETSIYTFPAFQKFSGCRHEVEKYITKMAVWFIGLHEFSHIKNGHLIYQREVKNGLIEADVNTYRAMEIHADITAATYMLSIISDWQKYVGKLQYKGANSTHNPGVTYIDELMFAVMAAYLALRCCLKYNSWDEYTIGLHESNQESHPLIELRMAMVFNVFLQGAIDLGENPEEKFVFANSLYRAIRDFENFYFENKGTEDDEDRIYYRPADLLHTEKGKKYYHSMFEAVLDLNEKLKDYTETPSIVAGQWTDYETLPERMFWTEE